MAKEADWHLFYTRYGEASLTVVDDDDDDDYDVDSRSDEGCSGTAPKSHVYGDLKRLLPLFIVSIPHGSTTSVTASFRTHIISYK